MELALIPGIYRNLSPPTVFPNGKSVCMGENIYDKRRRTERRNLAYSAKLSLGDMLERISLPEFEVKDSAGNTVTCAELTKGGKKILMWLEESREPTEHILNEMLEHAEKFHEFEIPSPS